MKIVIDGLEVVFPYDRIYKEQIEYMFHIKRALDGAFSNKENCKGTGHCLLEMPTGTGKTICLLAIIIAYKASNPKAGKLVYCTRTVPEMTKCMGELKRLVQYRNKDKLPGEEQRLFAICLSSRKNMCVHHKLETENIDIENVDSMCRNFTASWVRQRADKEKCEFYENLSQNGNDAALNGIYSIEDLKEEFGRNDKHWCPYFLARRYINRADVVVFNYQYLLDPKVANMVSREFEKESIIVFDEAHNIDNVCIEALSVTLDKQLIDKSFRNIQNLRGKVERAKETAGDRLRAEYNALRQGLMNQGLIPGASNAASSSGAGGASGANRGDTDTSQGLPIPVEILQEAIPGNIRKADHFLAFLHKIVSFLNRYFTGDANLHDTIHCDQIEIDQKSPVSFLAQINQHTQLERKPMQFAYTRLNSLMKTLEITEIQEFNAITEITNFLTLLATYLEGFAVIYEPQGTIVRGVQEPLLHLSCLDASLAMKAVSERFQTVILTSGTLSPLDLYPKLLGLNVSVSESLSFSEIRPCLMPLIVTKTADNLQLSTKFDSRKDKSILRSYGDLVESVCANVPDGVCCFFPSYQYMEEVIEYWELNGIINALQKHKVVFLETKDVVETTLALDNFKRCCDCGKGALLLSISRGKVAEGIDFDKHYGRCVIVIGTPYQYTQSHTLKARQAFMWEKYRLDGHQYTTFDAMRQTSQCLGRVIRSKLDYGAVILADSRFRNILLRSRGKARLAMGASSTGTKSSNRAYNRVPFPQWVLNFMPETQQNLAADRAVEFIKTFLRDMGQPVDQAMMDAALLDEQRAQDMLNTNTELRSEYDHLIAADLAGVSTVVMGNSRAANTSISVAAPEDGRLMHRSATDM